MTVSQHVVSYLGRKPVSADEICLVIGGDQYSYIGLHFSVSFTQCLLPSVLTSTVPILGKRDNQS
jgi:hypothetical protein